MPIETVKGFRDILYPESLKRQKIREVIEKNFKLFGFISIETPTVEYEELAKGDYEKDQAVSDMFKLKDRGNRELSLRYEFTFQLKRIFKEKPNIKLPLRRYQIGNIFRDEPIEKDRYREFMQCDADIIGDESIKADAECLALADSICKELGIKYKLKINNRKLLNSILEKIGIKDKENVLRELDKINKIGKDEVKKIIVKYANENQISSLFEYLQKDLDYFTKENIEGASELKEVIELCREYDVAIEFTPYLFRGFSYYTGNVFEAYCEEIKGSIFAGGRYDNLVGRYTNKKIPAVGMSLGRILDYPKIDAGSVKCIIISINQDKNAMKTAKKFREKNISCFVMDKISKSLGYANSYKIPYAAFLGEKEVKAGKIKLRDMKTGKEKLLKMNEAVKILK